MNIRQYEIITNGLETQQNCDYFVTKEIDEPAKIFLAAVFDGVNSSKKGADASRKSGTILDTDLADLDEDENLLDWLGQEFRLINRKLRMLKETEEYLTTASALIIAKGKWFLAHIGDSRIYRLNSQIELLTRDHTLAAELSRKGKSSNNQETIKNSHILLEVLGKRSRIQPFLNKGTLHQKDTFLLCTDGISDFVTDQEMCKITQQKLAHEVPSSLAELALKNGSKDDLTAVLVEVEK